MPLCSVSTWTYAAVHNSAAALYSPVLQDALALLRVDDLYVDSFEIKDGASSASVTLFKANVRGAQ